MNVMKNCLKIITNPKTAASGSLSKALSTLDEIVASPSSNLHPRLKHFLRNRSYEKALVWIEGGQPEKGTCGNE
jgi:hypothetical protein